MQNAHGSPISHALTSTAPWLEPHSSPAKAPPSTHTELSRPPSVPECPDSRNHPALQDQRLAVRFQGTFPSTFRTGMLRRLRHDIRSSRELAARQSPSDLVSDFSRQELQADKCPRLCQSLLLLRGQLLHELLDPSTHPVIHDLPP